MIREVITEDFAEISKWRSARNAVLIPSWGYPPTGLIWPGVAAGFLVNTDTPCCYIENVVSNPEAPSKERTMAILKILAALEDLGRELGYCWVLGLTRNDYIKRVCVARGAEKYESLAMYGKRL